VADWKQDRIGSALRGENPTVLRRLPSGFAVAGDTQFLPGYCVLLAEPEVGHLSDLSLRERSQFLTDMSLVGEAVTRVCRPDGLVRINYEILGNGLPCLHAHVFPRYAWEPEERRRGCRPPRLLRMATSRWVRTGSGAGRGAPPPWRGRWG
jgi:diadenosine tetraphosphate (Ap4A) HIT family hydrolase